MPNNHSKYRIPVALSIHSTAVGFHRDNRGAGIHPPPALVRQPFHFGCGEGKKLADSPGRFRGLDPGQDDLPLGGLQGEVRERHRAIQHVNHINPVRQGRIEQDPHVRGVTVLREGEFQILSLARGPGRGGASVRDLRVRREPSGKGYRQPCLADSPLDRARNVSVAGKAQPASFSVPDNQPLSGRQRAGTRWRVVAGHQPLSRLPATVSGSSFTPVGPVWISVPMDGHTPQS